MVKDYLEQRLDELLTEKIELERDHSNLQNRLRENNEFIKLLDEKNDPNYESFTPRFVNSSNKKKIESLKEEQRVLTDKIHEKAEELSLMSGKVSELNDVIRAAAELEYVGRMELDTLNDTERLRLKFLEIQELERQRIARELHDSSVQNMTSLVHKSELCSKLLDMDSARCKMELASMSGTIKETINEMREMIYDLRPMSFDDIGIDVAIGRELDRIQSQGTARIEYEVKGSSEHLRSVIGLTLFRVIQEACNNAQKHANASVIKVHLSYEPDKIELEISDDGIGFVIDDKSITSEHSGFGLPMMRERVFLLSGKLDIDSKQDIGTTIHVTVPLFDKEDTE